jgi:hypothetical protein
MKDRLVRAAQFALSGMQHYKRDHSLFAPPPVGTQTWMCPNCDTIHTKQPLDLQHYHCERSIICGWHGDRHELCRGDLSCLTTT